jgi:hypothetical protein
MDVREPEQQAMMETTTNMQRVGLVLILKSNFITRAKPTTPQYEGGM